MRELEDSFKHPFHQFIKVETRDEEISGKVWKVEVELVKKKEGDGAQLQLVLGKYMVENSICRIPLDAIKRITPLDVSFPPKRAHDQAHAFGRDHQKASYKLWFVEITTYTNTQFVGGLL